ncbi:MAG: hypothetical protein ACK40G_02805 [Cytophagaceae bacterium]
MKNYSLVIFLLIAINFRGHSQDLPIREKLFLAMHDDFLKSRSINTSNSLQGREFMDSESKILDVGLMTLPYKYSLNKPSKAYSYLEYPANVFLKGVLNNLRSYR